MYSGPVPPLKYRRVDLPPKPTPPSVPVKLRKEITRVLDKWVQPKPGDTLPMTSDWMD